MKISEILTEVAVNSYEVEEISFVKNQILPILKNHCNQFLKNNLNNPIYRGSKNGYGDIAIIDTTNSKRISTDTRNYYTLLLDHNPYMRNYPKRSNSLICSTSKNISSYYGTLYCILPFNGCKIGIVPDNDIWSVVINFDNPNNSDITLLRLNKVLQRWGISDQNYNSLVNDLKSRDGIVALKELFAGDDKIKNITPEQVLDYLNEKLKPENIGFELKDTSSFITLDYPDKEVWFSGKCLAIKHSLYKNIISEII
jgi:hypothetical protein